MGRFRKRKQILFQNGRAVYVSVREPFSTRGLTHQCPVPSLGAHARNCVGKREGPVESRPEKPNGCQLETHWSYRLVL